MSKITASKIEAHAALVKTITEAIAAAHAAGLSAAEVLAAIEPIREHLEGEDS
jgi:hypothetical protein